MSEITLLKDIEEIEEHMESGRLTAHMVFTLMNQHVKAYQLEVALLRTCLTPGVVVKNENI